MRRIRRFLVWFFILEGVDPDLMRFLVRSESDSIELRGLRESILRSLFLHAVDPLFSWSCFLILEGVDPDLVRFLVWSESDSIELCGLWESLLSHQ